jgi:hypothetical protein
MVRISQLDTAYFPPHIQKIEYQELSEQYFPDEANGRQVLVTALVDRAKESVRRVFRLREEKPPLQQMVREGVIGETLLDKLVEAEAEMEAEMQDVIFV